MLDGEVPKVSGDAHHRRQFHKSIQAFADASIKLCEVGKFRKLEQFLTVVWLFKDGNETMRNGIVNIYLLTLSRVMDLNQKARRKVEPLMPKEMRLEYARLPIVIGISGL